MKDVIDMATYRRRRELDEEDDRRIRNDQRVRDVADSVARMMVRLNPGGEVALESILGDRTITFQPDLAIAVGELLIKFGKLGQEGGPCPAG